MTTRREDFRKYLETGNAFEALTGALVSLYEEPEKPEDPLNYIRKQLGAADGVDVDGLVKENQELKSRISSLNHTISELETRLSQPA